MAEDFSFGTQTVVGDSIFDVDKLQLDTHEIARITVLEPAGKIAWMHPIKPATGDSFGNNYECLSSKAHMGGDPDECIACKYSEPGFDVPVGEVRLRGVLQIAQFTTDKKGIIADPNFTMMSYKVWILNRKKVMDLSNQCTEHHIKNLVGYDIRVECTNGKFHLQTITVSPNNRSYENTEQSKKQFADMQETRLRTDTDKLLGRSVSPEAMREIVYEAIPSLAGAGSSNQAEATQELNESIDNLF